MTCDRKNVTCGKVECRGCKCEIAPASDAEKTMKPHDWLIIMHATAMAMPYVTDDMRREFDALNAKAQLRYTAALDGKAIP